MNNILSEIKAIAIRSIFLSIPLIFMASCVDVDEQSDDVQGNTEALWQIMDQHYCFFAEKKEQLGVDWNDVHTRYLRNANSKMTNSQLFEFLGNMLGELKDGHVNLTATFNIARNWSWKDDYPKNFADTLQRKYLGTDYLISCGMYYRILDDNIGYIYLGSFEDALGEGNLDDVLYYLSPCNGLILDIRNNGGGLLTEAQKLAARFCNESTQVGFLRHKTGTGHDDFSDYESQSIEPSARLRWQKDVCVLTNRSVFSAANEFVKYMKGLSKTSAHHITIVGDTTGGGAGMPYSSELPNGWSVRFSACPMYDTDKVCTEDGIAPDVQCNLTDSDVVKGKDSIIEKAREILKK